MIQYVSIDTEIGRIVIGAENNEITDVTFSEADSATEKIDTDEIKMPVLDQAAQELKEYLNGERTAFDLPLAPKGTVFQEKVWTILLSIPYGETRSYGDIAKQIGNPKACRAVGMANNRNPISIIIPCHRVVGAKGDLVGYGGGLPIKQYLIELEKRNR